MAQVWVVDDLLHARGKFVHGTLSIIKHIHPDGSEHTSTLTGEGRRCDDCGSELIISSGMEKLLDLIDALNNGKTVTAIIFTVRLDRKVFSEMAQADNPMDIALRTIELEEGVELDHPLALAAA